MNKKVCVKIAGLHSFESDSEDDKIETICFGNYYKRNGKHYIKYEESVGIGDAMAESLLKISEQELEIISQGQRSSHMVFTRGTKHHNMYQTPFGSLNVAVDTYEYSLQEEEDRLVADIKYGLEVNLDFVSNCVVHIEVESVK